MKSPKPQPKLKRKAKTPPAKAQPSTRGTNSGGYAPVYIRLPPLDKPLIEYPSINHPRGK